MHRGTVKSIQRLLIVLFAGASAADYILKLDGAFYDAQIAGDLRQIEAVMAGNRKLFSAKARKLFVKDCRLKAEDMVRKPAVETAIKDVARRLSLRMRLSASQVKDIYQTHLS
jgi:hypothetical protein